MSKSKTRLTEKRVLPPIGPRRQQRDGGMVEKEKARGKLQPPAPPLPTAFEQPMEAFMRVNITRGTFKAKLAISWWEWLALAWLLH